MLISPHIYLVPTVLERDVQEATRYFPPESYSTFLQLRGAGNAQHHILLSPQHSRATSVFAVWYPRPVEEVQQMIKLTVLEVYSPTLFPLGVENARQHKISELFLQIVVGLVAMTDHVDEIRYLTKNGTVVKNSTFRC